MQNTKLKTAKYFTVNKPDVHSERYLVETQDDLNKFMKAFPENKQFLAKTLKEDLERGKIILLTDRTMSGFTSYCYETVLSETKTLENAHPTEWIRVQSKSI